MNRNKATIVTVAILGGTVLLLFIGGIAMHYGLDYRGPHDFQCDRAAGTTSCGDRNATFARLTVVAFGSDPNTTVASTPLLWVARIAFGLVAFGYLYWIVAGIGQSIRTRIRYGRPGADRGNEPADVDVAKYVQRHERRTNPGGHRPEETQTPLDGVD